MTSILDGDEKQCLRCRETKPYHNFWNKKQHKYSGWCQACQELGRREWHAKPKWVRKRVTRKKDKERRQADHQRQQAKFVADALRKHPE